MKVLLVFFSFICCCKSFASNAARLADVEVQFGPFLYYDDDDDAFLYDEDFYNQTGVNVWIGPGLYYGVWFNNEYDYRYWARRNYYYRHGWNRYHGRGYYRDGRHGRGGHGRAPKSGGHSR
jgi:hypothetical protein